MAFEGVAITQQELVRGLAVTEGDRRGKQDDPEGPDAA